MATRLHKITVYYLNNSRSIRITSLLEELSLPYTIVFLKRSETGQAPQSLADVHPLRKSPTVVIQHKPDSPQIVLHESAYILRYICEYWGSQFLPKKFSSEQQDPGTETEAWRRNEYFLVQPEGTLMPNIQISLIFHFLNKAVPFFIRPVTSFLAGMVNQKLLTPEFALNLSFIEQQLKTSGGDFLCGSELAAADFMTSFALESCMLEDVGKPLTEKKYPACVAYLNRLKARAAWKRAVERVEQAEAEAEQHKTP